MALSQIALGTVANDGTGDTVRVAGGKINTNFAALAPAAGITRAQIASYDLSPCLAFQTSDGAPWVKGASSGPRAIQDKSGQWWQIDLSRAYAHANWFGADPTGAADSTAALNDASTALAAVGGGEIDLAGGRYLVVSADFEVKQGVTVKGTWSALGEIIFTNDYHALKSCLVVDSSRTIRMRKFSGISGCAILRNGMVPPTDFRSTIIGRNAFAGTAITIGDGPSQAGGFIDSDVYVGNCFVLGFNTAVYNKLNERPRIEWVYGDCVNGIHMVQVFDIDHVRNCHFWPFFASHVPYFDTSYTVTGAANNGSGAIRLIIGTHILAAGDHVVVDNIVGTVEANLGYWTISAVGSTWIDLAGSTFTNAYISGGTVHCYPDRSYGGRGFWFENNVDWGQIVDCFCYGYDIGYLIDGCNDVNLINCGADDVVQPIEASFKFINSCKRATMIGCRGAAHGWGVIYDAGATDNLNASDTLTMTGCHFWGNMAGHVLVSTGRVTMTACHIDYLMGSGATTYPGIMVNGSAGGILCTSNVSTLALPITFGPGTSSTRSIAAFNIGPTGASWPSPAVGV